MTDTIMDAEYYAGLYDWEDDREDQPTACKYCGHAIGWEPTEDGRFQAVSPATRKPHRCAKRTYHFQMKALASLPTLP